MTTYKAINNYHEPTSLQTYVSASYEKLLKLFGEPNWVGDEHKISTAWMLEAIEDDNKSKIERVTNILDGEENENLIMLTIYDYKETELYSKAYPSIEEFRKLKQYDWHIGGNNKEEADKLAEFIMRS